MGAMKDSDGNLSANPNTTQHLRRTPTSRSSYSNSSYEADEASTAANYLDEPPTGIPVLARSPRKDVDESNPPYAQGQGTRDLNHEIQKRRRSHKPRQSGGFLLANTILDETPKRGSASRDDGRRQSRIPVDSRKGRASLNISDKANIADSLQMGLGIDAQSTRRSSDGQPSRLSPVSDEGRRHSPAGRVSRIPTLRPSTAPLDVDSTQIVNMALSLSESRRLAARRNVSSPIPPRLTQLPDTPGGGSLKHHLQQQRRTSRNISPKPGRALTPGAISSPKLISPLKGAFDQDGGYTYHFSSSTLNRAQKAKEYLELMAQYRRLLQFVPPLKQDGRSRPPSSSHSTSPTTARPLLNPLTGSLQVTLGRPYNPLQYIRNRKVRARERKAIDGEAQGFSDISRVTDWIDETSRSAAASTLTSGTPSLPPFQGAHDNSNQELPASNIPRPISIVGKPKRVRIDWSIDPADMLADAYWLEQDDNKYFIEDRHYSKIFPWGPGAQISASSQTKEPSASVISPSSTREGEVNDIAAALEADTTSPTKAETESSLTSARDRARQKLHDLRGIHHKQNGHGHHDLLRFRKGSLSDTSDSESDRKRRNRNGTITANGTDLLEKQMNEMLAKEASEEQKENLSEIDRGYLKQLPLRMETPEQASQALEPMHSRRGSRVGIIENLEKSNRNRVSQGSPVGSGRPSLEVPGQNHRLSADLDSSRPVSPESKSSRGRNGQMPTIGMDLSPPVSRPGSPNRKPFSRVKSIFRDRSRERDVAREKENNLDSPIEPPEPLSLSTVVVERLQSPDRRRSKSLTRKIISRTENHKSHRSIGSVKLRGDDLGLRSIFKGGARIDDVIRGGVSKVTDLIWKKDSDGDTDSTTSSSDDSDDESRRGRARESVTPSRDNSKRPRDKNLQKNYLDVMPPFKPATQDVTASQETETPTLNSPTLRSSRSPRFDRLKPPRIDIRKASPSSEPDRARVRLSRDFDVSDAESRERDSVAPIDKPQNTSKDAGDVDPPPPSQVVQRRPQPGSRALSYGGRHWSISNRSPPPHGAQVSRREAARIRTLVLCSGIKAMEISRRAHEPHPLFALDNKDIGLPWTDISPFVPDEKIGLAVPQTELFTTTARLLSESIEQSIQISETSTAKFVIETVPVLQRRVEALHDRVGGDLMDMTHRAADEADEVNRDLVDSQRLQVKRVVDTMDKMLRRRRRRFRWARRAGWLAVEWVLVGFMWYVWFVVTVTRVFLGIGKGVVGVVRWLLWL
ncbi:hypothetical protein AAE478_009228 [Parahypoxylon ruwenzoriense]